MQRANSRAAARSAQKPARSTRGMVVAAAADRKLWAPGVVAPDYLNGA